MMNSEEIFRRVVAAIVRANKDIQPESVHKDASLVCDLGMDSMRLATMFAEIKKQFGNVDLTGWYVSAARHGSDTVRGLVDYLARSLGEIADRPSTPAAVPQ